MSVRVAPARQELLGVGLDPLTLTDSADTCAAAIERTGYLSVGMVNAAKLVAMRRDKALRAAVTECGLVLADGQAVVWASRLLGAAVPERVTGIDLFTELLARAARQGHRAYFLGARSEVLRRMLERVQETYPGLVVAGARDGYFRADEEEGLVAQIRLSNPDLLFVGMSSPGKELFVQRWGEHTGARVVHGVGGSFDVLAGIKRRAPLWWQRHGLEWLYRAGQEPVRLGRRYLTTNAAFMAMVAREAIGRQVRFGAIGGLAPGPAPGRPR